MKKFYALVGEERLLLQPHYKRAPLLEYVVIVHMITYERSTLDEQ